MKIRMDFVTNSSSSSYIILSVDEDVKDKIIDIEGIDEDDAWDHLFRVNRLEYISDDDGFRWLGHSLGEQDLRSKTLNQLEIELVDDLNRAYNLGLTIDDIYFDNDIIYC